MKKQQTISYEELIEQISGEYLTETLSIKEQVESDNIITLVTERLTEPFEDYDGSDIMEWIENGATSLKNFLVRKGIDVL